MSRAERPAGSSIAVSIFALVFVSVGIAAAVFFAVTFRGPPPRPAPQSVATVVAALRTGRAPPHFSGEQPLRLALAIDTPTPRGGERPDAILTARIAAALGTGQVLAYRDGPGFFRENAIFGGFSIAWRDRDVWRIVATPIDPWFSPWRLVALSATLGMLLLLGAPAWWLSRALSRPLRQLADTAVHARAGAPLGALPRGGASEVRDLTRAVSDMHHRLTQHAQGRTTMLAAIAHDLGTPLSRIAFRIEQLPDEARTRALADIEEMRAMLGAALRFVRDEGAGTVEQRIDLASLLDSLVEDMAVTGAPVSLDPGARVIVRGDPAALRRLFANLIENAVRYGEDATVRWQVASGRVDVTIDDSGPGFDLVQAVLLFEPFVRGDPSRNRGTGGTGLGLAIVRSIAEAHGGTVTLENQPGGGRAHVTLPILPG